MSFPRRSRWLLILILTLAGFFLGCFVKDAPVYEVRATLRIHDAQALSALPEILEWRHSGLSAYAIPGTYLLETACRSSDPDRSANALAEVLAGIPTALSYLGLKEDFQVLQTLSRTADPAESFSKPVLGGIGGLFLGLILLFPQPKEQALLSLPDLGKRVFRCFRRRWGIFLLLILLAAVISGMQAAKTAPVYRSAALVRAGEFDSESNALQTTAVQGLYHAGLSSETVTVSGLGSSNLLQLTADGPTPEAARAALQAAIDAWPQLEIHSLIPITLTVLESPNFPDTPVFSGNFLLAALKGAGFGLAICLGLAFLYAPEEEKSFHH